MARLWAACPLATGIMAWLWAGCPWGTDIMGGGIDAHSPVQPYCPHVVHGTSGGPLPPLYSSFVFPFVVPLPPLYSSFVFPFAVPLSPFSNASLSSLLSAASESVWYTE